jgi:hypothetical protein
MDQVHDSHRSDTQMPQNSELCDYNFMHIIPRTGKLQIS